MDPAKSSTTKASIVFRLVVPTFTPFDDRRALAPDRVPAYADWLRSRGIGEVFVNGTSGEFASLTVAENRLMAARWCAQRTEDLKIIVHVGHIAAAEARELAVHAEACGADAISATPPFYFQPGSLEALIDIMGAIAAGAPRVPFYYYHIPGLTGVQFPMWKFLTGVREAIPNFDGLKFTYEDLSDYRLCLSRAGVDCEIFFGRDEMLLSALAAGATSGVGTLYNLIPDTFRSMVRAHAYGDLETAQSLQTTVCRLVEFAKMQEPLPVFKAMMGLAGFDCGPCRLPLGRLEPSTLAELPSVFNEAELAATATDAL